MKKFILRCGIFCMILVLLMSMALAALPEKLVPVGSAIGLRLQGEGMLVVDVEADSSAAQAGVQKGDWITRINGTPVESIQTIRDSLTGQEVDLTVQREGKETTLHVPLTQQGARLGVMLRDSMTGVGTVTYWDPTDGSFGALGHGVSDRGSTALMPVRSGDVFQSQIVSVEKGRSGAPGQLKGAINPLLQIGTIAKNTDAGIFGTIENVFPSQTAIPVAGKEQVKTGAAQIRSNVIGTDVQEYDVEILRLYPAQGNSGRNILLRVTDPALLEQTGGIVQGMSGSPIIQDGKLIGAVTHVLVSDPTTGYGIFIETMLDAAA